LASQESRVQQLASLAQVALYPDPRQTSRKASQGMFGLPSAASFTGLEPAKTHESLQSQRSGTLMLGEFKRVSR